MSGETITMGEAAKELHNYGRVLLAATLTAIFGLVALAVTVSMWGGRLEQRVSTVEGDLKQQHAQILEVDAAQRGMTGRLATIEERTGNIVKGLDRIESKVDSAVGGTTPKRRSTSTE